MTKENPNLSPVPEAGIDLASEQYRQPFIDKLTDAGFTQSGNFTRRQVYQDIDVVEPDSTGYKPTLSQTLDQQFGQENWGLVPTGREVDSPDPWGDEAPEITSWNAKEYTLFTRDPKIIAEGEAAKPQQSFYEIEDQFKQQAVDDQIRLK